MELIKSDLSATIRERVGNLPTLPDVALKLLELTGDDDVSINQLMQVISHDPAISSRILKVANSAYYGFSRQVTAIDHAITLLGLDMVRSLALSMKVFDYFRGIKSGGFFNLADFWLHSIAVSSIARDFVQLVPLGPRDLLFTAGLLHDIGKLLLLDLLDIRYLDLIRAVEKEKVQLHKMEKMYLGMDHAQTGAFLLERWEFPQEIVLIIHDHHLNLDQQRLDSVQAVILADILAREVGLGTSGNVAPDGHVEDILQNLGIDIAQWDLFCSNYKSRSEKKITDLMSVFS
ncbi:MAG: HDOD domain-containing protein [Deltaproteobacteria bacterium]|nr:HDOD domain-containing protein [Deltaproteobacteria bacterium]MBW2051909.1 HDOD domain-containing protein [Deltaproteobacteria bacterium]MBW2140969.1 HDOD domain-containing protein [Deltaproteobacteria bacterium]MBW2322723.1 HDOD domain-containing protein [Deltaproteobacteria bacterium]